MSASPRLRRTVARMRAYAPPLEGRRGNLRLDFNENTAGCSLAVRRALVRLSRESIAMYPEYEPTRRSLARYFRVRPEEMLLTNGTDEALRLVFDGFVDSEDTVLLVEPTFAMYRFYAELAGARVLALRYRDGMEFPMSEVLHALRASRPRVFFLANPNNPTGTLLTRADLRRILKHAQETVVVVDEAYFEFSGVTLLDGIRRHPNLIVTRTFSKAMGLAGLRLGFQFANARLAAGLHKAQSPYSVNAAALVAAETAARDGGFIRRYVRGVQQSKRELLAALRRLDIRAFPSGGNFVLVDFGSRAARLLRDLRRRGILLRDRKSDFARAGYVRITLGTIEQMRRLIRALEETWRS